MVRGMEHLCNEEGLRGMGLLSLENKKENIFLIFYYKQESCFSRGKGFILQICKYTELYNLT